jgi:micrococcal nuclease
MYEYKAEIIRVIDGDTIEVDIDLGFCFWARKQTIRLFGVDAPEIRSRDKEEVKYGKMSKAFVEKFCRNCNDKVIIQTEIEDVISGKEKFGRILGIIKDPESGRILNTILIEEHLAVRYDGKGKEGIKAAHLENRKRLLASEGEFN